MRAETFDGNIQLNRYDAEGLRYEMEENGNLVRFIFNQDREAVAEEDSCGLNRLIRGTELIAASSSADSARTYYHYASDEMGSTTHIVDEAGAVKNRYEYDAWGNITAQEEDVPNRFKFTGQQLDPVTQQYYLRARFYNPVVGQFTQEDTCHDDGLNLFAYCRNNPVTYVDPSGYSSWQTIMAALESGELGPDSHGNIYAHNHDHGTAINSKGTSQYTPDGKVYFWGQLQSHHLLQGAWAEANLKKYGYEYDLAPTITLETNRGLWTKKRGWTLPHTIITNRQIMYGMSHPLNSGVTELQTRLIEGASDLLAAGIDRSVVDEQLEMNFRMIEKLKANNAKGKR